MMIPVVCCGGILGMQVTVMTYQLGAGGLYVLDFDQVDYIILDQSISPHSCYYGCYVCFIFLLL